MTPTPVLEGFGIRLVPLAMEHLPALEQTHDQGTWTWMSESGSTPELMRALAGRALEASAAGTTQAWTATILQDDRAPLVAGSSRLADLDAHHRRCELGWTWIAPALRGSSMNARMKLLQLQHAFETLGMRRVALKTHHNNIRSQRAMLKLGAYFEGVHRQHMIMPDGTSRDTHWFSIIDGEWPAVRARLLERIENEPLPSTMNGLLPLRR